MTEQKKEFPSTEEELRLDRDLARQELGETAEALAHKLDVKARANETLTQKLDQATATVADTVSVPVAARMRRFADVVRANPMQALGAFLALIVVGRIVARRKKG